MTRGTVKAEVFRRLREVSSAPVAFSVSEVETAIAEAYAEMSDATEWYERWLTVDLLDRRPYYDLRTVIGADLLAPGQAFHADTNRWLEPATVRELDARDRRWEMVLNVPARMIQRSLWWLGYWPTGQSDSGSIKQYYTALPPAFASDDDEPGFPEPYHFGLVECALSDLWAQDGESQLALGAWDAYLAYETGLQAFVDGRSGAAQMRGYGGQPGRAQ